jgi:hypothetical protein
LSHAGIVSVPYAIAAMACAPPTRYTSSTPASAAAASVTAAKAVSFAVSDPPGDVGGPEGYRSPLGGAALVLRTGTAPRLGFRYKLPA